MRHRLLPIAAATVLSLGVLPPAGAVQPAAPPPTAGVVVIDGKGWGHGVGMAQDGALAMGLDGASTGEILGHFYPGTGLGSARGEVRVDVLQPAPAVVVISFPHGGDLRSPRDGPQHEGFPVKLAPGGQARVAFDGSGYTVEALSGRFYPAGSDSSLASSSSGSGPGEPRPAPGADVPASPSTTAPPDQQPPAGESPPPPPASPRSPEPVWALPDADGLLELPARGRRYRGVMELTARGGPFRVLNQLDVEQYLRGMGEVRDPSWPQASLQAQAIAARTYALRAMTISGEICDTQRCQVYLGQQAEYGAMDRAVAATAGHVLTYGGRLAVAVYSANAGGHLASPAEGFGPGSSDLPYLRPAPYPTRDPKPWRVELPLDRLARRAGYRGTLHGVEVRAVGPSGRPTQVALTGDAGEKVLAGVEFQDVADLRSTFFGLRIEQRPVAVPATGTAAAADPKAAVHVDPVAVPTTAPLRLPRVPALASPSLAPPEGPDDRVGLAAAAMLALVSVALGTWAHRRRLPG